MLHSLYMTVLNSRPSFGIIGVEVGSGTSHPLWYCSFWIGGELSRTLVLLYSCSVRGGDGELSTLVKPYRGITAYRGATL